MDIYRNDAFVGTVKAKEMFGLPHEPILVEDTIGQLLESEEGFSQGKAKQVRTALNAMAKYGVNAIPLKEKLRLGWCMLRYRLSYADGVRLYGKYVGGWGGAMSKWRFEGKKDGVVVSRVEKGPSHELHIRAIPSKRVLEEGDGYDMAAVRIRIEDSLGNPAVYAQLPLEAATEGPLEIAGPSLMTAEGGMSGVYVKTTGEKGEATLKLSAPGLDPVQISFAIK